MSQQVIDDTIERLTGILELPAVLMGCHRGDENRYFDYHLHGVQIQISFPNATTIRITGESKHRHFMRVECDSDDLYNVNAVVNAFVSYL